MSIYYKIIPKPPRPATAGHSSLRRRRAYFEVVFLFLFLFTGFVRAQSEAECGTDVRHQYLLSTDSVYKKSYLKHEQVIRNLGANSAKFKLQQSGVYTVPVVVHVIHNGEPIGTATNLSDTVIQNAINGMNLRFSNLLGNSLDIGVQFCLASLDPNGNPTNGITRNDGSGIANYKALGITISNSCGASEFDVKDLSRWPVTDYVNIWVVNTICPNTSSAYATLPIDLSISDGDINIYDYDGIVIRWDYMKYTSTTLTHEMGHIFGLLHTFQGATSTTCASNVDCTVDGDGICDTPPHLQNNCLTIPCAYTGTANFSFNNYMSYCPVRNLFTPNQKIKMVDQFLVFPRETYLNSKGCSNSNAFTSFNVNVFPTLTNDLCFIELEGIQNSTVKITLVNTLGECMLEENVTSTGSYLKYQMNVSGLEHGVYYVLVYNGDKKIVRKLCVL